MVHVGFDVDGVLADFNNAFLPWYNQRHQTAFVETDFWTHDFFTVFGVTREQLNADIRIFVQTHHAEDIQPYPGMPAIVRRLANKYKQLSQVTARFTPEALHRTRLFSDRHYPGCFGAVHISHHFEQNPRGYKGLVCQREGITILVEDQVDYALEALDHGVQVVLINRPWNVQHEVPACVPRITIADLETTLATMLNGRH